MSYDTTIIATYVAKTGDVVEVVSSPFSTEIIIKDLGQAWWDCYDVRVEDSVLYFTWKEGGVLRYLSIELR